MHVNLVFVLERCGHDGAAGSVGSHNETLLDRGAGWSSLETYQPGLARQPWKRLREARDAHLIAESAGEVMLHSHSVHRYSAVLPFN